MSKRGHLIVLAVLLGALLPSLLQIAWPFLTSFMLASILAIVLHPMNQWLTRRIHRPGLATSLTTCATVLVLGSILTFVGLTLVQELSATYDALSRRSLEEGGWPTLVTHTTDRVVEALAVLWGTIGGLASIIPVVGSPLVWLPVVAGFLFTGSYWKALLLGLWGALVVGSVDNVLRPFVVCARDKQHPILIALAAIGGTYAFGVLGILLGPVVVSLAAALLKEIQELRLSTTREPQSAAISPRDDQHRCIAFRSKRSCLSLELPFRTGKTTEHRGWERRWPAISPSRWRPPC